MPRAEHERFVADNRDQIFWSLQQAVEKFAVEVKAKSALRGQDCLGCLYLKIILRPCLLPDVKGKAPPEALVAQLFDYIVFATEVRSNGGVSLPTLNTPPQTILQCVPDSLRQRWNIRGLQTLLAQMAVNGNQERLRLKAIELLILWLGVVRENCTVRAGGPPPDPAPCNANPAPPPTRPK